MDNITTGTELHAGSPLAFENVFKRYFKDLHRYAFSIVKDEATAEEMVQNIFLRLWEKREQITIEQSVQAYLYRAVFNECLNFLKSAKTRKQRTAEMSGISQVHHTSPDNAAIKELQQKIDEAIAGLPEQCRIIFHMSRFEELRYRAIAERLGISEKTVENQVSKALKIMRRKLAAWLPALAVFTINIKNFF